MGLLDLVDPRKVVAELLEAIAEGTEKESDDKLVALIKAMLVEGQSLSELGDEAKELALALLSDFSSMEEVLGNLAEMSEDNCPELAEDLHAVIAKHFG